MATTMIPQTLIPTPAIPANNTRASKTGCATPNMADADNVCASDIAASIVFADGTTQLEPSPEAIDAPVDCIYVYPTVSSDAGGNSDLVADNEIRTTIIQAARYRSVCKLYAPLYRQVTVAGLSSSDGDFALAYGDVLDAFKQFVARGDGRGFMLVGHSQGTAHLMSLIAQEIENQPWLAERMIAAHLIGISVAVPNDAEVGGTFQSTPACTVENDIHCFVKTSAFARVFPPRSPMPYLALPTALIHARCVPTPSSWAAVACSWIRTFRPAIHSPTPTRPATGRLPLRW